MHAILFSPQFTLSLNSLGVTQGVMSPSSLLPHITRTRSRTSLRTLGSVRFLHHRRSLPHFSVHHFPQDTAMRVNWTDHNQRAFKDGVVKPFFKYIRWMGVLLYFKIHSMQLTNVVQRAPRTDKTKATSQLHQRQLRQRRLPLPLLRRPSLPPNSPADTRNDLSLT